MPDLRKKQVDVPGASSFSNVADAYPMHEPEFQEHDLKGNGYGEFDPRHSETTHNEAPAKTDHEYMDNGDGKKGNPLETFNPESSNPHRGDKKNFN